MCRMLGVSPSGYYAWLNRDGLARAITELLDRADLRRTLGEAGRRWAKSFSWDATARKLFEDLV